MQQGRRRPPWAPPAGADQGTNRGFSLWRHHGLAHPPYSPTSLGAVGAWLSADTQESERLAALGSDPHSPAGAPSPPPCCAVLASGSSRWCLVKSQQSEPVGYDASASEHVGHLLPIKSGAYGLGEDYSSWQRSQGTANKDAGPPPLSLLHPTSCQSQFPLLGNGNKGSGPVHVR